MFLLLPLEGIDSICDIRKYFLAGINCNTKQFDLVGIHHVIDWICITNSTSCALIPEIQKLVDAKWESFGKPLIENYFCFHLFRVIVLTLLAILMNQSPQLCNRILYPLTTFTIGIALFHELPYLWEDEWRYWGFRQSVRDHKGEIRYNISHIRGVAIFDKFFMTIMISSYLILCASSHTSPYFRVTVFIGAPNYS